MYLISRRVRICEAPFLIYILSPVARGNHTYYMAWCLPGERSRKTITPMASKYPEDLQYLGYLHFMTHFCVL